MTNLPELQSAITNLTNNLSLPGPFMLRRNAADAAYEAYVFMLVLRAIVQAGGQASLRSINSTTAAPATFVFRGSPGAIYSQAYDYGYAACTFNGQEFEVHVDVLFFGNSRVLHEIDVSILDSAEAVRCRDRGQHPTAGKTYAAFECKFYSGTPGTFLIRTFEGLAVDMGRLAICRFVSNAISQMIARYCTNPIIRPRFTANLVPEPALLPLSEAERQFVDSVVDDLRNWRA